MKKIDPPLPGSTWVHTRCQRPVKILRVMPPAQNKPLSYVEYYYPRTSGRGPGGFHRTKCPPQQLPLRAFLTLFAPSR